MISIYKITNIVNDRCYIGQTKRPTKRLREHHNKAKYNSMDALPGAIRKYGIDKFSMKIIDSADDQKSADFLECHYIQLYKSHVDENGYNMTIGGNGIRGLSKFAYKRIGNFHRNKPKSLEQRRLLSIANTGHVVPIEVRQKISIAHKGKKKSDITRAKISTFQKTRIRSQEEKDKIRITVQNLPKLTCPHCNKIGSPNNMKRWHFENCNTERIVKFSYVTCPHCNKIGFHGPMTRWHFENCKKKGVI